MSCKTYDPCLNGKLNQIGSYASVARQSAEASKASATQSAASATSAAESAAEAAASAALAGIYLGAFAIAPVPPIEEGALYFNTVSNQLFVWNGTSWSAVQTDDIYLGGFAVAPTLNNQGLPLVAGNLYWNTASNNLWAWNGSAWVATNFNEFTPLLATGTTSARNLVTRMADVVNVKDFGAVGDGIADDTAAIQAAITFGATNNKGVYLPSGDFICSNKITTLNGSIVVFGDGINATKVIFTSTNGGFDFNLISQGVDRPPEQISFSDLTLESNAAVSSPALSATWSTYQPNAQGQAWINNLNITRKNNGTGSFTDGIKLTNCIIATVSDVIITGDDLRVSGNGVNIVDSIGIFLTKVQVNRYQTGAIVTKVSATSIEGFVFDQCAFYDVYRGIFADTALAVNVTNTHVNINGASATVGIDLVNCSQSFICDGCLIYAGGLVTDPAGQIGIRLTGNGNNVNNIRLVAVQPVNVVCGISINSGFTSVFNSNFDSTPVGILIGAGSSSTYLSGNQFYNNTTPITNNGTNTVRYGNSVNGPVFSNIDSIRWGSGWGTFVDRQISSNSTWGAYIRGAAGTSADVSLVTSGGNALINVKDGVDGVYPQGDNTYSMGTASQRWSVVYAATGTINTSDEREKTFLSIEDSEKLAALEIKQNLRKFKFNSAIEEKGENARIHFGASAQQVGDIMKSHDLDPNKYGFYCYDEWDEIQEVKDEKGNVMQEYRPAGNRYGLRYEELLAFIISAI